MIPSKLKRPTFAFALFLVIFSYKVNAQQVISLQKAIDLTLQNNLNIKQAQLTEALADEDFKQSKNNLLPIISANPQATYNHGKSQVAGAFAYASSTLNLNGNASISVTLFQGGQLKNQILQNKLILDADKTATSKVKNDLILNQVDLAILILKQFMEMPATTDILVEKPDISKLTDIKTIYDPTEVIKTALTVNPDIKLAETQQQTYLQAIKVAKGNYYPTLSLFGGLGSNYSNQAKANTSDQPTITTGPSPVGVVQGTGQNVLPLIYSYNQAPISFIDQLNNNFNQSIGLSLQIPIFNRFTAQTSVRKAKISYQNAELATQIAKNNLSKTIIQAILDLHASEKSYQSALQTFESNKEALNVTKQRFEAGLVNTLEYNTALTNYNKSQNDMIEGRYQMIFRSKVIDYYLGNQISL